MWRTSSCSPQPAVSVTPWSSSTAGHGTVTLAAAWRTAASTSSVVNPAGGGAMQAAQRQAVAASSRMTAWKWTAPRRWYSATLANDTRTSRRSSPSDSPASWARRGTGRWSSATTTAPPGRSTAPARRPGSRTGTAARPALGRQGRGGASSPPAGHADTSGPAGRGGRAAPTCPAPAGCARGRSSGREGHEQPRVGGHGVGDALAATEASGQELEAVGLVGRRAGGAHRGAAVAAGLQ
jgi:hypothetical protein